MLSTGLKTVDKDVIDQRLRIIGKTFDLIGHNILSANLQEIGLYPSTLSWIFDFPKGRLQRIELSPKIFSNWKSVNAGFPRGTKLGPSLFLLTINDLEIPNDQFDGDMMKYADNTDGRKETTSSLIHQNVKISSFLSKGINQTSLKLVFMDYRLNELRNCRPLVCQLQGFRME